MRPLSDRRLWKPALQALAAVMMQGETPVDFRRVIPRHEAEQELSRVFPNEQFPVRDILDDLLKYHLLQNRSADQIEFRHQLVQEYYAAEYLLRLLPELSDEELKRDYLNLLKWTEPIALMLALVGEEDQALQIVKLALDDVDLILGAKLAGEVKLEFQGKAVELLLNIHLPAQLQLNILARTRSESAISELFGFLKHHRLDIRGKAILAIGQSSIQTAVPRLLKFLEDEQWAIRRSTVMALGEIGGEAVIPGLLKALKDQHPNVRESAIDVLEKLKCATALPTLLESLNDPALSVHGIISVLKLLDSESVISSLVEALDSQSSNARVAATKALGEIGSQVIFSDLIKALKDPHWSVRSSAAIALGKLNNKAAIPSLIEALTDPDPDVNDKAVQALGKFGDEAVTPDLLKLLKHRSLNIRETVVAVLRVLNTKVAVAGLIEALNDRDSSVRLNAALALGELGNEAAFPELCRVLRNGDYLTCYEAIAALEKLDNEVAIPELLRILEDQYWQDFYEGWGIRDRAAKALGQFGSKAAPGLLKIIKCQPWYMVWRVAEALAEINDEASNLGLLEALVNLSRFEPLRAIPIFEKLDSEVAVPALLMALEHSDVNVREKAVSALGRMGCEAAIPGLLKTLEDQSWSVREATVKAFEQLSSSQPIASLWCTHKREPKIYIAEAIANIQSHCKYYNHEVAHGIIP